MSFSVRKLDGLCRLILVSCDCVKCWLGLESSEGSTGLDMLIHGLAIVPGWQLSRAMGVVVASSALWSQGGWTSYIMATPLRVSGSKNTRWKPMAFSSLVSEVPRYHFLCMLLVKAITSLPAFKGKDGAPESRWEWRPHCVIKNQVGWAIL